ncbi:hypothetical protein LTR28_005338 [Elasticomyces elasticus]|nr:hypothetical protein LTR28_005338 [Elasticomyces elasticus]
MSYPYDRRDRRRPLYAPSSSPRTTLGYWVPLVVTVSIATAGLVAWIWSERSEGESDDDESGDGRRPEEFDKPPSGWNRPTYPSSIQDTRGVVEEESFRSRVSSAIRRTPSPQQLFDAAGHRLAAGVVAAGAVVGGALGSIREEDDPQHEEGRREDGFSDHERWSEEAAISDRVEAQSRDGKAAVQVNTEASNASARSGPAAREHQSGRGKSRRTIAVVVSAETKLDTSDQEDLSYRTEHAVGISPKQSVLSHLSGHVDPSTTRLFVLIYAPYLTSLLQTQSSQPAAPPSTLESSYSVISTPSQTPGEEDVFISRAVAPWSPSEMPTNPDNRLYDALHNQALTLVEKSSMILPFTTPTGYIHILRHLSPSLAYICDSAPLSGRRGENVKQLSGWVGQTVVVVGDEGHGGLVDTETEDEGPGGRKESQWWEDGAVVGLGKAIDVVDAERTGDDWRRRVGTRE